MSALVEQGVLGAIIYIWLCIWGLSAVARLKALQRRRVSVELTGPAAACCAGIAVVWAAGQFTDYLQAEVQIWLFALLAANLEHLRMVTAQTRADTYGPPDPRLAMGARRAT